MIKRGFAARRARESRTGNNHYTFEGWGQQQTDDFFSSLRAWEEEVTQAYTRAVKDETFDTVTSKSINMRAMLDALPYKQRVRLMHQYKNIIGFEDVIRPDSPLDVLKGGKFPARQLMVDPAQLQGPNAHPLAFIYNRFFIQGEGTTQQPFDIGRNILRSDYLRDLMSTSTSANPLEAGKKVLVFDTETTGLPFGSARHGRQHYPDIRQISAAMMQTDEAGRLSMPSLSFDKHFRTARMQIGHIAVGGKSTRIDDFIKTLMGGQEFANRVPGSGTDFVNAMKPFLRQLMNADYIVGQNIQFDIDQVFSGLTRTAAYQQNTDGFRDLLDQARTHVLQRGRVRDTLEMARVQMSSLRTAKEIAFHNDRATKHSLENLMLRSNLPDLLRQDLGDNRLLEMIGARSATGTMHAAEVDTTIEAYLFKYLTEGRISDKLGKQDEVADAIRQAVLRSYAPTPISNIKDLSHISPDLFAAMVAEGDSIRVMDFGGEDLDLTGHTPDSLRSMLVGRNTPHATFRITPLEQEIFSTRRMLDSDVPIDSEHLAFRMGQFRRWAGQDEPYEGFLNRFGSMFRRGFRPSDASFGSLQNRFAREGIPFAGLSMPERWLTSALARNSMLPGGGGALTGSLEQTVGSIADDIGISRFKLWEEAYVSPARGKNITLPVELLQEAERQGVLTSKLSKELGSEAQMLSLSGFETKEGRRVVNLVYNFEDQRQASALANWLGGMDLSETVAGKKLWEYGIHEENLGDIIRNLPESGAEHGIAIGRLEGQAGEEAFGALQSFNQGLMRDADKIPMRVGFMGTDSGVARVGAVVLDRFMGEAEKTSYAKDMVLAMSRQEGLEKAMQNNNLATAAKLANKVGAPDMVERSMQVYSAVKKRLPIIGGIAAAAIGTYYIAKKTHEQNKYDAAISQMQFETQRDYDRYRRDLDMPKAPARRMLDPLSTAGTVGSLDRNKIGHNQMGMAGKYSELYVGAL